MTPDIEAILLDAWDRSAPPEMRLLPPQCRQAMAQAVREAVEKEEKRFPSVDGDGTDRLCRLVYRRSAQARDYIGGANAHMLHDAANRLEEYDALRTESAGPVIGKDGNAVPCENCERLRVALDDQKTLWKLAEPLIIAGSDPIHVPFMACHRPIESIDAALAPPPPAAEP